MSARRKPPGPEYRRVYWDSCVFIAWLTGESRAQIELDGLHECVDHASRGLITIVVSDVFENEVLVDAMPPDAQDVLRRFLRQRNVEVIDLEAPIRRLATEIRTFYTLRKRAGEARFVPSIADTFHLATAINRQVDAFFTFDKGGRDRANLLSLSGDVAGHPLVICIPPATQLTLGLSAPGPATGRRRESP